MPISSPVWATPATASSAPSKYTPPKQKRDVLSGRVTQNNRCLYSPLAGAVQAFLLYSRDGVGASLYKGRCHPNRLTETLFYNSVDRPISIRHIGIYRLLLRITLKNPITKKTALTSKNDKNTMS